MTCFKALSLLLIVTCSHLAVLADKQNYCIGSHSGKTQCPPSCHEIDIKNISNVLTSNSIIYFCQDNFQISSVISASNLTNITLLGQLSTTVLKCSKYFEAGLTFINIDGLKIENIGFHGCSAEHNSTTQYETGLNKMARLSSALYLLNCTNVHIDKIRISNSSGIGLVFFDVGGVLEIFNSIFDYNTPQDHNETDIFRGGGIYLELTVCSPGIYCDDYDTDVGKTRVNSNSYTIMNCTFENNAAKFWGPKYSQYTKDRKRLNHQGLGRGGGLSIQLNGHSKFNTFNIISCTFKHNEANWGGGLYIVLQDHSSNNYIWLKNLTLEENICDSYGGGGIDLGFNVAMVLNNTVTIEQCDFLRNRAKYGGGMRVYASRNMHTDMENHIHFRECSWIRNEARFGSAIDIAPHAWEILSNEHLPVPTFHNCMFLSNAAKPTTVRSHSYPMYTEYANGRGAMMLTKLEAIFSGSIVFKNNIGTAVYLSSSIIYSLPHSTCTFTNNKGFQGGAISFIGFSALIVTEHNTFIFTANKAIRRGGALYANTIDKHDFVSSRSCFIQYIGSIDTANERNVSFLFTNNIAGYESTGNRSECFAFGHAIFSHSLLTCIHSCNQNTSEIAPDHLNTFKCVGKFFFNDADIKCQLSTSGGKFSVNEASFFVDQYYVFFPGREINLPISVLNDFSQTMDAVYYATIRNTNGSNIRIRQPYTYISNRKMLLHGNPGSTGTLTLQNLGYRKIMLKMSVRLMECPPGYIFEDSEDKQICVCSSFSSITAFKPIKDCDKLKYQAYLRNGYWFGFSQSRQKFEYGYCPSGYCSNLLNQILLPKTKEKLNEVVCGKHREGRLCGQCTKNFSVHYHGTYHLCKSNHSCDYGWLLYFISELFPLTVLFVLAVVFNVTFTSGAVNGFIFFSQVIHSFPVTSNSFIIFPKPIYYIYIVIGMIYNLFNFDFFSDDRLSFCLWKGATTMDMLVFKFVTVVYVLFLLVITFIIMNHCNFLQKCSCLHYSKFRSSIIHGLSSVLVIVFSQSFNVCFQILEIANIYGEGDHYIDTVVFRQGILTPFKGDHIKYAVIAMLCMIVVTVPTLILLAYPLCFKLLLILKCSDTNSAAKLLFHTPYSRLRPFLDSFQSCFNDKHRYFAGLYFLYRILVIFTSLFARLTQRYFMLDIFLTSFLLIHAITHPYQKSWHNTLDSLLFFNLIVINKISWFNYDYLKANKIGDQNRTIPFTTSLTVIMMTFPLLYLIVYILTKFIRKIMSATKKRLTRNQSEVMCHEEDDFELTNRDENSDSDEGNFDYHPF